MKDLPEHKTFTFQPTIPGQTNAGKIWWTLASQLVLSLKGYQLYIEITTKK